MDTRIPTLEEINDMTDVEYKVLENRLRRAADRQGLQLQKSRQRDPNGLLYGTYQLVDIDTNGIVLANWTLQRGYGVDLADVAEYLFAEDDDE
ncbi:MAG TPA: hypothetical protein VER10_07100 [Mycobacterium sp.]|jgi:hypothetical protein|nr:hypothetical protein [Mycobacterium sp.]